MAGNDALVVTLTQASGVDLSESEPQEGYARPARIDASAAPITEVVMTEDAGGLMTWVIGLDARARFGYQFASQPDRLIVEVLPSSTDG